MYLLLIVFSFQLLFIMFSPWGWGWLLGRIFEFLFFVLLKDYIKSKWLDIESSTKRNTVKTKDKMRTKLCIIKMKQQIYPKIHLTKPKWSNKIMTHIKEVQQISASSWKSFSPYTHFCEFLIHKCTITLRLLKKKLSILHQPLSLYHLFILNLNLSSPIGLFCVLRPINHSYTYFLHFAMRSPVLSHYLH